MLASKHEKILWIDSSNQANTHSFESKPRLLDKIHIARAFTALQHHQLCKNTGEYDLIIAPEIDKLYNESSLYKSESVELFENTLNTLDGKIICSIQSRLGIKAEKMAENTIKIEKTSQGLKYSTKSSKTKMYHKNCFIQTTVPAYEVTKEQWEEPIKHTETV